MYSYEEIVALAQKSVSGLSLPHEPARLYDPIRYTLQAGGKRIRPLLTLGSFALFSDEMEKAVPTAMAVEVFHNFTLLHDDIMDDSSLRRGRETVHVRWNQNTAILSGDAMLIYAYELAAGSAPEKLPRIIRLLNRIFAEVCQGQQYDMDFENRNDVAAGEYLHMIGLKTGALIAGSMQAGAILGGAEEEVSGMLYEAGMDLGTAFQLQDDLLDTYGEASVWGKNTGDDIADNKKTYLLIKALESAGMQDRERLLQLLSSPELARDEKIDSVKALYARAGVKELTEALVEEYFDRATARIDAVPVDPVRKEPLRQIARTLIGRKK